MTKSVLNTLWLTGGGLVATWFAVNPISTAPVDPSSGRTARRFAQITSVDNVKTAELKAHHTGALKPAARNPFEFGRAPVAAHSKALPHAIEPAVVAVEAAPSLSLSGIAARKAGDVSRRTAIIAGDGQLYLVTEGEMVAGRYRVVSVGDDSVSLRDDAGRELRLVLR